MNFERSPFFIPWAPRKVRRARSVSFETLMFQRTASSITHPHMWINTYTLMVSLNGSAVKRAVRDGFGFAALAVQIQIGYYFPTNAGCATRQRTMRPGVLVSSENLSPG